jgi:hypothetical protein
MLRPPRVSRATRHFARSAPGIKDEPHLPEFEAARSDSIHRPLQMRRDLCIRCVREEPERVENFLLFRSEVLCGAGVSP